MRAIASTSRDLLRVCVLASFVATGCAGSRASSLVRDGRLTDARAAYAEDLAAGESSDERARELAREALLRDVRGAQGLAGVATIRAVARCARHFGETLADKATGSDATAAEAALVRLENGPAEAERASYAARRSEPTFRIPGTRALVLRGAEGAARRGAFLDPDPAVRRAALAAAAEAADSADVDALLEAARVDPEPLAQSLALRALGRIGGDRVILALADRYVTADEPLRQGIVAAWSSPACFDAGGRSELLRVSDGAGAPAIAAAHALLSHGGAGAGDAAARLARAIDEGPARDRLYALNVAPLADVGVARAVRLAAEDAQEPVRIAALAKLYGAAAAEGGATAAERKVAEAELLRVGETDTTSARTARFTLAQAHHPRLATWLARDSASKDANERAEAGELFVELGDLPRAAALALDMEHTVRARVACAVLSAPERD
jgi:hypothetical protein